MSIEKLETLYTQMPVVSLTDSAHAEEEEKESYHSVEYKQ
jgi:hypothetical protein